MKDFFLEKNQDDTNLEIVFFIACQNVSPMILRRDNICKHLQHNPRVVMAICSRYLTITIILYA